MASTREYGQVDASSQRGVSLVEVLIAGAIAMSLFAILVVVLSGSLKSFGWASASEQGHAQFLVLREYLGRDIQHAITLVDQVSLDRTVYETNTDTTTGSLVLRLPAIAVTGEVIPAVYDFAVYTVEELPKKEGAFIRRRLFTTRDANGDPLLGAVESTRVPDDRVLLRGIMQPRMQDSKVAAPIFILHPPVAEVAREVELALTLQLPDETPRGHTALQTYTTRFRLRNL